MSAMIKGEAEKALSSSDERIPFRSFLKGRTRRVNALRCRTCWNNTHYIGYSPFSTRRALDDTLTKHP